MGGVTSIDRAKPDKSTARLSVVLAADTMRVLRALASRKNLSVSEAIRRAIAAWKFIEEETERGNRIAVIEERDGKKEVREVVFLES